MGFWIGYSPAARHTTLYPGAAGIGAGLTVVGFVVVTGVVDGIA